MRGVHNEAVAENTETAEKRTYTVGGVQVDLTPNELKIARAFKGLEVVEDVK